MDTKPGSARETVANYLTEQILGPTTFSKNKGLPLPAPGADGKVRINKEDSESAFYDSATGDPVLINSRPKMVFGTGVLHAPRDEDNGVGDGDNDEDQPVDDANDPVEVPKRRLPTTN